MYDALAHRVLRQSRHVSQPGTAAHDVQRRLGLLRLPHLVQGFGLHQQHVGIAVDYEVGRIGVVLRRDSLRHQELADVVARVAVRSLILLAVEVGATFVEDGQVFSQVAFLPFVHKLLRRQVPAVAAGHEVRVARTHESRKPRRLRVVSPEVILRAAGILHLEQRLGAIVDGSVEVVGKVAGSQVVAQGGDVVAQVGHVLVILAVLRSQRQLDVGHHRHGSFTASTAHVLGIILGLRGQQVDGVLAVGQDLLVGLLLRVAGDGRRLSWIVGRQAQGHAAVQAHQDEVIVRTKEIRLAHAAVAHGVADVGRTRQAVEHDVTLSDAHPRRTPHVQSHGVVALRDEVGRLYGLQAVGAPAGTHFAVAGHDVQRPKTLVVHVRRLERAVAGSGQRHGHVVGHVRFRVYRIEGRLVQEVAARGQHARGSQSQYEMM